MDLRFTRDIFENSINTDMPNCNLHVNYSKNNLNVLKNDKKIKYNEKLVMNHFRNIVKKTFENFKEYSVTKNSKKFNLMFTKKGTLLEWGILRNYNCVLFFQRYSKDGLQALLSVELEGDLVNMVYPIFNSGFNKYKKSTKDFKVINIDMYQKLKKEKNSLKNFKKRYNNYISIGHLNFLKVLKTKKLDVFETMCHISIRNPLDLCFINESNYFMIDNFNKQEIKEIIKSSKFSTYSSLVFSSSFLNVKINDIDYVKEVANFSTYNLEPKVVDTSNELYIKLMSFLDERKRIKEEKANFERSFFGIIEEELEIGSNCTFFEENCS